MPYGQLDAKQRKALKKAVAGKRVHDLGCGDQLLAGDLAQFGAAEVIAIDSHPYGGGKLASRDRRRVVTTLRTTFAEYAKTDPPIDMAFVSWPANRPDEGLLTLLKRAATLIYLGKCTDGTCCGWPGLFTYFLSRELLVHVPDEYNTLFVYGGALETPRTGEWEERAGLDWTGDPWSYYGRT